MDVAPTDNHHWGMRALIYDPDAPAGVAFGEVPEPVAGPGEAVVAVRATSLNFGELAFMSERQSPGFVPGNDLAGVVLTSAGDGSGPRESARVVAFAGAGGWAERAAVDVTQLAVLPDGVDFAAATTLPAAGVTALRALRGLGAVVGRRVLITGASGGVGRFAVQLAAQAGAHVVAAVGRPERARGLTELGAAEVVTGLDGVAPVFGVLDNVGGPLLAEAFALLEPGGLAQSIGQASLEPTTIDFEDKRFRAANARIAAFGVMTGPFGSDLADLVAFLADGTLDPQIGWRGEWSAVHDAIDALRGRRVAGKAVLEIPEAS